MKQMKKSELKNGMHVITKNGDEFIVIDNVVADKQIVDRNTSDVILVKIDNCGGWLALDRYDENLNSDGDDNDDDFKIVAIYKPLYYYDILLSVYDDYHGKNFVQIYGKKKMTKAEIEQALGYEIEIVD